MECFVELIKLSVWFDYPDMSGGSMIRAPSGPLKLTEAPLKVYIYWVSFFVLKLFVFISSFPFSIFLINTSSDLHIFN